MGFADEIKDLAMGASLSPTMGLIMRRQEGQGQSRGCDDGCRGRVMWDRGHRARAQEAPGSWGRQGHAVSLEPSQGTQSC